MVTACPRSFGSSIALYLHMQFLHHHELVDEAFRKEGWRMPLYVNFKILVPRDDA